MNKQAFADLFTKALQMAADYAQSKLGRSITRSFEIELHGAGYPGTLLSSDEAAQALFLGEDRFFRVIDIAVVEVRPRRTRVFVRASSHPPGIWDEIWNQPPGMGPFKQIQAMNIRVLDTG